MSHPSYSDPDWMQKFLHNAAKYFENRPTDGEDTAYWANTYHAEKCRKIANEIEKLRAALLFMVKALEGYGEIDEEDHLALTAARAALGEKG
jgi:hypothetical protein